MVPRYIKFVTICYYALPTIDYADVNAHALTPPNATLSMEMRTSERNEIKADGLQRRDMQKHKMQVEMQEKM
jgi:hypothetical protein